MARPRAAELTARELEVMHVFWNRGESTAAEVRETLAGSGRDLAYTTVATLIRILSEKEFIAQANSERPFRYRPRRSFDDVSGRLLGDLLKRVFRGSREHLLVRLMEQRKLGRQGAGHPGKNRAGGAKMNGLGQSLLWCFVQVSLLALVTACIGLLASRRGPAAGAFVSLCGFVATIALTATP